MYSFDPTGRLVELKEEPYAREIDLQRLLSEHPALLSGEQMNSVDPRRFILVTEEAGIAITEGAGSYFSLDLLYLDQDGIPTLVEVKRSADTRLRREVVAQLLEYAANACAFWKVEQLRSAYEGRCLRESLSAEQLLTQTFTLADADYDTYWNQVSANLQSERLRLVFVADVFAPETQRIIEFLNRQMTNTEVFAIEIRQYLGQGVRSLIPRVLNPSIAESDRKTATSGRGEQWTSERFYSKVLQEHGQEGVRVFDDIEAWARATAGVGVSFGRGKQDGSIQIYSSSGPAGAFQPGDAVFLTFWTYGKLEIDFEYLLNKPPFDRAESRAELARRLCELPGVAISEDKHTKRPNLKYTVLAEADAMRHFLATQEWIVRELREHRTDPSAKSIGIPTGF